MFIESSEKTSNKDKNYLRIFLKNSYPYTIKHNDQDVDCLELLFEEPSMSDMSDLKKLGISLEKLISYESVKSIRIANSYSSESLEAMLLFHKKQQEEKLLSKLPEDGEALSEEDLDKSKIDDCRDFIQGTFNRSSDFENEDTDFYKELDKFFNFLDKKCKRDHNGLLLQASLSLLDKYNADAIFIKQDIVTEYISFFFSHFPSRTLRLIMN